MMILVVSQHPFHLFELHVCSGPMTMLGIMLIESSIAGVVADMAMRW